MGHYGLGSAVTVRAAGAAAGGWSKSLCTPTRPTARVSMSPPSSLKGIKLEVFFKKW